MFVDKLYTFFKMKQTLNFFLAWMFVCGHILNAQNNVLNNIYDEVIQKDDPLGGTAVAIVHKDEIIFQRTSGFANLEHRIPITDSTKFHWASVSKQFAGMAIAKLILDGKLNLSDNINAYVPELPIYKHPITVENLVYHTSGLREWSTTLNTAGFNTLFTNDDVIRMVRKQQRLNYEPGTEFSYNNTGYTLLSIIVENVSGLSFDQYVRQNFFEPLRMRHSSFRHKLETVISNRANSYSLNPDKAPIRLLDELAVTGASGLYASISDMAKWARYVANLKDENPNMYKLITQKGFLKNGHELPYSFGFWKDKFYNTFRIDHTGSWAGFKAYTLYLPEKQFAIVGIRNFEKSIWKVQYPLLKQVMTNRLQMNLKSGRKESPSSSNFMPYNTIKYPNLVGTYKRTGINYIIISEENSVFKARVFPKNWGSTKPSDEYMVQFKGDSKFEIPQLGISFRFENNHPNYILVEDDASGWVKYKKIASSVKYDLKQYTGTYFSEEMDVSYTVENMKGTLYIFNLRSEKIPLKSLAGDDFDGGNSIVDFVSFVRNEENEVIGLEISTERSRHQKFNRQ